MFNLRKWLAATLCIIPFTAYGASSNEIIDGVSEFLIERGQSNLNVMVERKIKNDKYFKCYFPKTHSKIEDIHIKHLFLQKSYWEKSLRDDLETTLTRSVYARLEKEYEKVAEISTKLEEINQLASYLIFVEPEKLEKDGTKTGFLSFGDSKIDEFESSCKNWPSDLKAINAKFESLKAELNRFEIFIDTLNSPDLSPILDISKLLKKRACGEESDDCGFDITVEGLTFCRLLGLKGESCTSFIKAPNYSDLLENIRARVDGLLVEIADIKTVIDQFDEIFILDEKVDLSIFNAHIERLELIFDLFQLDGTLTPEQAGFKAAWDAFIKERKKIDLYKLLKLLPTIQADSEFAGMFRKELVGMMLSIPRAVDVANQALENLKESEALSKADLEKLKFSIMFFALIADAEDKNSVKAILTDYTLPDVSFDLKRKHSGVFVTAYLGAGQFFESDDEPMLENKGFVFAPIGLELNKSLGGHSFSLNLAPVDFGYPVSLKLHGVEEEVESDQVFAPSLNVAYGVKDWPVAIGASIQEGRSSELTASNERYLKWFVAFDMPLWKLF